MKCIYYLAPTLPSAHVIADDLHAAGIDDFYLHVVAQDDAGLQKQQIHSANYLETRDILRDGYIGAALGCVAGLIGIALLGYLQPFGPNVSMSVYTALVAAAALFGAWEGGLYGIDSENRKLRQFRGALAAGKYLILVYVGKHQEAAVRAMMLAEHPEASLVGLDRHFINPFSSVRSGG